MNKWDSRMLTMAKLVSTWSKDKERQVGAVITTSDYRVIATGFNGYPAMLDDSDEADKLYKTVHAEINALMTIKHYLGNLRLFLYGGHPCAQCAVAILQTDVEHIICSPIEVGSSWENSMTKAAFMLKHLTTYHYYREVGECGFALV